MKSTDPKKRNFQADVRRVARAILRAVVDPSRSRQKDDFILSEKVLENSDYITQMVSNTLRIDPYDYGSSWDRYCNKLFNEAPRYMGRLISNDARNGC